MKVRLHLMSTVIIITLLAILSCTNKNGGDDWTSGGGGGGGNQSVPPNAPTNLIATAKSDSQIDLAWSDNSDNENGFAIERRTGDTGTYSEITRVGTGVISYSDTGLTPATTYYYRVFAYNSAGNSGYSNEANATTGSSQGAGTWTAISTTNAPSPRSGHAGVWSGSEMVIWGGGSGTDLVTGGKYNPETDTWSSTTTVNAPSGRCRFTYVWAGTMMIIWGGDTGCLGSGSELNTGGRYYPSVDLWVPTTTTNAPTPRTNHTAVWSGTQMIVWGGGGLPPVNTGGRYDPSTDSWQATSTTGAPSGRFNATAVWT